MRALDQQAARRDDLRTRAGALVAAASVVTAFLGGAALGTGRDFEPSTWVALVAFSLLMACAVFALVPRGRWNSAFSTEQLLETYVEGDHALGVDDMHRDLAINIQADWQSNSEWLRYLVVLVHVIGVLLIVETAAWLVTLQGR